MRQALSFSTSFFMAALLLVATAFTGAAFEAEASPRPLTTEVSEAPAPDVVGQGVFSGDVQAEETFFAGALASEVPASDLTGYDLSENRLTKSALDGSLSASTGSSGPPPVRVARYVITSKESGRAVGETHMSSISLMNPYLSPETVESGSVFIFERDLRESTDSSALGSSASSHAGEASYSAVSPENTGMRSGAIVLLPGFFTSRPENGVGTELIVVTATKEASLASLTSAMVRASHNPRQVRSLEAEDRRNTLLAGRESASALYEAIHRAFSAHLPESYGPRVYAEPDEAPETLEAVSREVEAANQRYSKS